ncbi:MAG: hypothetical protein ABIQ02_15505 [Saprospiraceae bacterium]
MKQYTKYILVLMLFAFLFSCKKKVTQEELIHAAVEIKMNQWREVQVSTCKQKILTEAENFVDSVLVATSLESKLDTISKPEKPPKPIKPEFKPKPDSVIVKPIYKKEK